MRDAQIKPLPLSRDFGYFGASWLNGSLSFPTAPDAPLRRNVRFVCSRRGIFHVQTRRPHRLALLRRFRALGHAHGGRDRNGREHGEHFARDHGLEKALGVPLVRHNARPLELTKEGAQALKRMETILRAHDALISQISDDRRSLEGKIRLSSAPGFASRRLTGLLHRFKELHPEMTIEILGGLKEADVQKGFCEVATLTGEPTLSGLVYMSRGRNVYLPVASPEYVKRFGMPFSPENLRTHTGYVYNGPVREETKMLYRGDDAEPVVFDRSVRSTDILAIRQALLDGMGVAVDMPLVQIVEDLRRGALVPILPGWFRPPVECFNVTNRAGWRSRRVRIFFEWYSKAMQDLFASYEAQVSAFVGLPEEKLLYDRNRIYFTDAGTAGSS